MWEFIEYMVTHSLCQPVTAIRLERRGKGSCLTWDTSFLDGRHQSLGGCYAPGAIGSSPTTLFSARFAPSTTVRRVTTPRALISLILS